MAKRHILDVRLTDLFDRPYIAYITVKSYSTVDGVPHLSSSCQTPEEMEYWLELLEKDIAAIRAKTRRYFSARPTKRAPDVGQAT